MIDDSNDMNLVVRLIESQFPGSTWGIVRHSRDRWEFWTHFGTHYRGFAQTPREAVMQAALKKPKNEPVADLPPNNRELRWDLPPDA